MKNQIPRISTRGYYDLDNGDTIKNNTYFLYPKKSFEKLSSKNEITIMVHGLRNNKNSAVQKFLIAERRLKQLGYIYPVIGFSYDSNTKGAHIKKSELKALHIGKKIAQKNGRNLSKFILDFKNKNPKTKIRLIGHSLGSNLIYNTIQYLSHDSSHKNIIESVHFFGSSIPNNFLISNKNKKILQKIIHYKITNYYSPFDEVLKYANTTHQILNPIGLLGYSGKPFSKLHQKKVHPQNHRFVSYAKTMISFP